MPQETPSLITAEQEQTAEQAKLETTDSLKRLYNEVNTNPKTIEEYFRYEPEMLAFHERIKNDFQQKVEKFIEKCRGTPLEETSQGLTGDFPRDFDTVLLEYYKFLDLRNRKKAMEKVKNFPDIPDVTPVADIVLSGDIGIYFRPKPQENKSGGILINYDAKKTQNISNLKHIIYHEALHHMVSVRENGFVEEGIIEILLEKSLNDMDLYDQYQKFVKTLINLDEKLFFDWVSEDISIKKYRNKLYELFFSKGLSDSNAKEMAIYIVDINLHFLHWEYEVLEWEQRRDRAFVNKEKEKLINEVMKNINQIIKGEFLPQKGKIYSLPDFK